MKTSRQWLFLMIATLFFVSCDNDDEENLLKRSSFISSAGEKTVVDLIAGQHIMVGSVIVENDLDYLYVTYSTNESGWVITETHLHVGGNDKDFPLTGVGNPVVGHFDYGGVHSHEHEITYKIAYEDLPEPENGEYYVAAHAVVSNLNNDSDFDHDSFTASTPIEGNFIIGSFPSKNSDAYFENITLDFSSPLFSDEGIYTGYCIDSSEGIEENEVYSGTIYSIYDENMPGTILKDEEKLSNFVKVNWLLNQHFVGEEAEGDLGVYTFRDMQVVIWELLSEYPGEHQPDGVNREFSQERVDHLLAMAREHGVDFYPVCGDILLFVIDVDNGQNIIVPYRVNCYDQEETAWGDGYRFTPQGNWAMYFAY
ncbi:hypothetical protein QA597_07235 [Marinilabiliaceae bacterium ANBcel2]|nr:hypothetical protein [Marinilabiliaceae bacterium ANBcel2]